MKRRFSQLQDEPLLRLQLANDTSEQPPLQASTRLLHACSTCAFGLPRDSSTWDLSNLLIDGQPVSRDTVLAWLNAMYMHLDDIPFSDSIPDAAASATRLYQLLAFADAVGSSRGVVKACLGGLEDLAFEVKVGEQQVQLAAETTYQYSMTPEGPPMLYFAGGPGLAEADEQQQKCIGQQVAGQLEPLLYLAYRLQLGPLQEVLHAFIRNSTVGANAILYGHMRRVLTHRVLLAAVDCDVAEQALLQLLVGQRGSLAGAGDGLFEPVTAGPFQTAAVTFEAKVAKPLPSMDMGGLVDVKLDFNNSSIKTNGLIHMFQLLLGPPMDTPARRQAVMGEEEDADATPA